MRQLLDFIARYESRGDYNIVWGGIRPEDRPKKPLVQMTVQEVLDWQDSIDRRYMSEAAGRYQVMEDTLRGLVARGQVSAGALFDAATQDAIAVALMRGRGLDDYLAGNMSAERFANNLAREWASLPVVSRTVRGDGTVIEAGSSYYSGDGLNAAHAPVVAFLDAVRSVLADPAPAAPEAPAPVVNSREGQRGLLGMLVAALAKLFGGRT